MRANRLLGAGLVEANLVKIEDLEKANERLLEIVTLEQPRQSTVLGILAYELKVLSEEDVLQYIVDNEGAGLVDLRGYEVHDEDFHFMATAYHLSPAVRSFWEKQFTGPILWFGTTLEVIADYLEKLSAERAAPPPAVVSGTRSPFGTPSTGTRSPFGSKTPFPKPAAAAPSPAKTPPPAGAN